MKKGRALRLQSGFTIVELLVVIVVIAILAVIVIVAYNGIIARAEQAKVLSAIDVYEKALRLYESEKGTVPPSFLVGAPANSTQHPNSSYPDYYETTSYGCIPGTYPASGDFRAGECQSVLLEFTPDSTGVTEPLARGGSIAWPDLETSLMPAYISKLPIAPDKNDFRFSYSQHFDDYLGRAGVIKYTFGYRGVMLSYYTYNKQTSIYYIVLGDKSCGRGDKATSDIVAYYQQNFPSIQDLSASATTITQCTTNF